jgi:hypothetical protein
MNALVDCFMHALPLLRGTEHDAWGQNPNHCLLTAEHYAAEEPNIFAFPG